MHTTRFRLVIASGLALALAVAGVAAVAGTNRAAAATPAVKRGKVLFVAACGSCHTLAAARTKGTAGPNLARESGSFAEIVARVRRGGEGMPAFGRTLTRAQIANIARFVVATTPRHGGDDD